MRPRAILTFDLEFWHNSEFLKNYLPPDRRDLPDCVLETTSPLLDLLQEKSIKATFFILGELAEKYPDLIKKIFNERHHIASHGYSHKALGDLDKDSFEKEIVLTGAVLERITGEHPIFYRSPAFSLSDKMTWAFDILKKHNLKHISKRPAFSGGIYFRFLPLSLFSLYLKIAGGNETPILYFHPCELFNFIPRVETAPWLKRKIKYVGAKSAFSKFKKLLEKFDFVSINEFS